jgi:formate dehydrogenase iron-sulfur subunit
MYAILIDVTKCVGCELCAQACVETNGLNQSRANVDRVTSPDGLSADRLSTVLKVSDGHFAKKSCMHCLEPSCVSACLVGGITKRPDGPVVYDPSKCIGCRYCMLACPFHIPRYEWHERNPYMKKCAMCFSRIDSGQLPACVEACPNKALIFGERSELLKQAHDTIAKMPSRYQDHVWGEEEFGGTSVLYISDVDLEKLNWPHFEATSIPSLTVSLIEKTPFIGLGVATCLLGLSWIIKRRMQLSAEGSRGTERDNKSEEGEQGRE